MLATQAVTVLTIRCTKPGSGYPVRLPPSWLRLGAPIAPLAAMGLRRLVCRVPVALLPQLVPRDEASGRILARNAKKSLTNDPSRIAFAWWVSCKEKIGGGRKQDSRAGVIRAQQIHKTIPSARVHPKGGMVPRDRIELSTPAFSGLCSAN